MSVLLVSRGVSILFFLIVASVSARPTVMFQQISINLGNPLQVYYDISDGLDGRTVTDGSGGTAGTGKFLSQTGNDWIGLYKRNDDGSIQCSDSSNNQEKHRCYIAWASVPAGASTGLIQFEQKDYKSAGQFDVRYFYGNDPTHEGEYAWLGQGWVCNVYTDSNGDNNRDLFTQNAGYGGNPGITSITLAQCQCDHSLATQTLTGHPTCTDITVTTQAACVSSCSDPTITIADPQYSNVEANVQAACTGYGGILYGDRVWTSRAWTDQVVTQEQCQKYRAACGLACWILSLSPVLPLSLEQQELIHGKTGVQSLGSKSLSNSCCIWTPNVVVLCGTVCHASTKTAAG